MSEYILFDEPYTIKKKVPCHVSFQNSDKHLPPDSVLERGANAVRSYWNSKNLRKREVKMNE